MALQSAGGQRPLGRPGFPIRVHRTQDLLGGRCGRERPAEVGGERRNAAGAREERSFSLRTTPISLAAKG